MASPIKRCAIYTRKSTEEGLEQEFNSLDAQREACENYILSQKAEGWRRVKTRYDDGGLSGGNMERPALKALLADIDAGRVDIVVVYKVDRLTRSLADFAKLVEQFDKHGVSFVSVTQAFNTSNSMGRLTLNVLLSFAQFEREVTAERIRDKIAASRKKGLWTGGVPPLGYDVIDKKLIIAPTEAKTVQRLFELYLEHGCARDVVDAAKAEGLRTKCRGNGQGGKPITRGPLYWILSNPIYAGYVRSGDTLYDGVHDAIIDRAFWDKVQEKLKDAAQRSGPNERDRAPLAGKLFANGERLTPTAGQSRGRRYRYYMTEASERGRAASKDRWRINADELEGIVLKVIDGWLANPHAAHDILKDRADARQISLASSALKEIATDKQNKPISERIDQWSEAIERVDVNEDHIRVRLVPEKLIRNAGDLKLHDACEISSKIRISRSRHGLRLILGDTETIKVDQAAIQLIARSHALKDRWFGFPTKTIAEIADEEGFNPSDASRLVRLAFLGPDIVEAIMHGDTKVSPTASELRQLQNLPACWQAQADTFLSKSH
ncbi:MAG: recombinase family protein [Pseudomonadota bacterium]